MTDDTLVQAAAAVDVIDAAGRIIANPRRNAIAASAAEVLALAMATERFWAVCVEAEVLARALAQPAFTGHEGRDQERDLLIEHQAALVRGHMAALRGETNVTSKSEQETKP